MKGLPLWHQDYVNYIRASHLTKPLITFDNAKSQTVSVLAGVIRRRNSNAGSDPEVFVYPSLPLRKVG